MVLYRYLKVVDTKLSNSLQQKPRKRFLLYMVATHHCLDAQHFGRALLANLDVPSRGVVKTNGRGLSGILKTVKIISAK